jgi:hypothetical protein
MAKETKERRSRREFVKKAAYIAPAILTLTAAPAYAKAGSKEPRAPKQPKPPKPPKQPKPPKPPKRGG